MRFVLCVFVVGCSASSSVGTPSDGGALDTIAADTADGAESDTSSPVCTPGAVNSLSGVFPTGSSTSEPAWEAKTVLRIDRASAPKRPLVVFLSKPVGCSAFADKDWTQHVDSARFLSVEIGDTALASYPATDVDPPPMSASFIAHGSGSEPGGIEFPIQYTTDGFATVTAYSTTAIAGTFEAGFVGDPKKAKLRVCGRFDATACAVGW